MAASAPLSLVANPDRDGAPLSFGQQRLWLTHQVHPETYMYNVPRGLRLRGSLDVAALERSINEIVRRHEVLRTSFQPEGATAVQKIAPELHVPLVVREAAEDTVVRMALDEYERPF